MGLKSGTQDSGLDGDDDEPEKQSENVADASDGRDRDEDVDQVTTDSSTPTTESTASSDRPDASSIPYKQRREKVNAGREQVPYFLREHVIDAEDELQDSLESMLGETVYKSDYREAAMVVAQRNPELVAEVLREWGYDL